MERTAGTRQGGVVNPLLANLFMHYAFDDWMRRNYPHILFERYADDIAPHCRSREQAQFILDAVRRRLKQCKLEPIHVTRRKVMYLCIATDVQGYQNLTGWRRK